MFKLGYIDYLNCYPFYYHHFEKEPVPGIEVVPAYPEELNILMTQGQLDMSPISAAAYAAIQENVAVIADFCLSSVGYVQSVVLRSTVPIEHLDGKIIGLTKASRTSVILLKILLEKYYAVTPVYTQVEANPDMSVVDAALVIGNEAMLKEKIPVQYAYDLGDLWYRMTGHAVVFALFVVNKQSAATFQDKVKAVVSSYKKSLTEYKQHAEEVIVKAHERYPDVVYDIHGYYNVLKFDFNAELKKALLFYYAEAYSLGLLEKVDRIEYW